MSTHSRIARAIPRYVAPTAAFKPTSISGLVAWYSAEAETGYTDGAAMTGWTDQSGLGNHAVAAGSTTPLWRAAQGASSGPAVRLQGSGYFNLPASLMSGATSGEVLLMVKADSTTQNKTLWSMGVRAFGSAATYAFTDGNVYESFGSDARKSPFTPTVSIAAWRRYNLWSASNDWAASLDGTTQATSASNTVAFDTTAPTLGVGWSNGVGTSGAPYFTGYVAAFVLFSRKLTTTERSNLQAWMVSNPSGGTP